MEDEIDRGIAKLKKALMIDIFYGKTTVARASRAFHLTHLRNRRRGPGYAQQMRVAETAVYLGLWDLTRIKRGCLGGGTAGGVELGVLTASAGLAEHCRTEVRGDGKTCRSLLLQLWIYWRGFDGTPVQLLTTFWLHW